MKPYYMITAINRLTNTRERVSGKLPLDVAERKKDELVRQKNATYTYPKVEIYQRKLFYE